MRKFLSERNFVVVLFVVAFVVFYFAQEDAKKVEHRYMNAGTTSPSFVPSSQQTAGNTITPDKETVKSIGAE